MDESKKDMIDLFLKVNSEFKIAELSKCRVSKGVFPYRNNFSFMFAISYLLRPTMELFKSETKEENPYVVMEMYEMGKGGRIIVALPFGKDVKKDYHLTNFE